MIKVTALTKHHKDSALFKDVHFEVRSGSWAAILGPSGAGKTTLLRCLVGIEPFDSGTVTIGDHVADSRNSTSLRGRIGLVFQSLELFPHLTVIDNCILAPTRVRGLSREAAEEQSLTLLSRLGLSEHARAYPEYLSGGQRQRVAIARALAMQPRALLYDEPTSALDPSLKREVVETIRRIGDTGVTQIVVTHDAALAHEADSLFLLDGGALVELSR